MEIKSIDDLKGLSFRNNNNTLILDFQDNGILDTNIICGISVIGKMLSILIGIIISIIIFIKFYKNKSKNFDLLLANIIKSIGIGLLITLIGYVIIYILNKVIQKNNRCVDLVQASVIVPYEYISYTNGNFSITMDLLSASKNYIKNVAKGDMVYGKVVFDDMNVPTKIGQKGFITLTFYQKTEFMALIVRLLYGLSSELSFISKNGKTVTMGYDVVVTKLPNITNSKK